MSSPQHGGAERGGADELSGVKAQRRKIDREQYGVELARKDFYPDFTVGLTYFNRPGMPEMYGVNVGVKIPLYFWQKQRPAVAEATASARRERAAGERDVAALLPRQGSLSGRDDGAAAPQALWHNDHPAVVALARIGDCRV